MLKTSLILLACLVAACGSTSSSSPAVVDEGFKCNDRRVAYELTGGFAAQKIGVAMSCVDNIPTLASWRQDSDDDADRKVKRHNLSSKEFNILWGKIDSSGWRHLEDCDHVAIEEEPTYVIRVGDHSASTEVSCSGKTLPFPYDSIVNELDLKAAGVSGPT